MNKADTAQALSGEELSYFTGFFEADGHTCMYSTNKGFMGNIGIEQVDKAILETFQSWFGGQLHYAKRKSIWTWNVYGHKAKEILYQIIPYMKTYRVEKAKRFIAFWSTTNPIQRQQIIALDRKATEGQRKRLSDQAPETVMRQSNHVSVEN